jgi:hypothetical protein
MVGPSLVYLKVILATKYYKWEWDISEFYNKYQYTEEVA